MTKNNIYKPSFALKRAGGEKAKTEKDEQAVICEDKKQPVTEENRENDSDELEKCREEMARLQEQIKKKNEDIDNLQEMYASAKDELGRMRLKNNAYLDDREELIALRNYVHNLTEEWNQDGDDDKEKLALMEETIAQKKIVVVGGHKSWVSRLKKRFGNWVFISPEASSTFNGNVMRSAEHVYFFSEYISHSGYFQCKSVVLRTKLPFGYISSTNIDNLIRQVYGELCVRDS